ncbi:MAG: YbaK/EbsC family protein [Dermatophilaceae bacterium]
MTVEPSSDTLRHPAVDRVSASLAAAGITPRITVLDGAARTAALAAAYLGIDIGQIANSLVFRILTADTSSATDEPLLVLTSGAHRVDTAVVAAAIGVRALGRADADFVRDRTGFVIGGVAPVGHLRPVRTLIDVDLAGYDEIWAAAGHPNTVFPTTYDQLVSVTGAEPVTVTAPSR